MTEQTTEQPAAQAESAQVSSDTKPEENTASSFVGGAAQDAAASEGGDAPAGQPAAESDKSGSPDPNVSDDAKEGGDDYADFTTPEGVDLDTEVLGDLKALAKQHGLPQDAAQAFVDLGVKLLTNWAGALEEQTKAARAANREAIKADPLFAGPQGPENLAAVARANRYVRDIEGLSELLDVHGLGDHPAVAKMFLRFGQALSEDTVVGGASAAATLARPQSLADRLYAN